MKKIIFYVSVVISLILLVNIVQILLTDFKRLTEYGYGYLIGKIILFFIFIVFIFLTKKTITKKEQYK
ncbi:conserved hypothetical protein [Tenacibaculum piscium]|uniref:Uncharacterized protein n=1 Tax=Tenacibaculum piscium TaxID=1458515 RepID=A0A2H1YGJ5_9FLAO|nr:conserved hypothetical protein [Tenacibaculum piscium]